MTGIGTLVNVCAIILGGFLGLLFKGGLKQHYQDAVLRCLGLCTPFIGAAGGLSGLLSVSGTRLESGGSLGMILSLVLGTLVGERYKMATKETKDILSGKYGATVKPFNPDVVKKVLGDNPEVITCRPADLIPDELATLEKEMEQYKEQDEDVLSYALFPQVATDFFKYREAQEKKVDATIAKDGSYPV